MPLCIDQTLSLVLTQGYPRFEHLQAWPTSPYIRRWSSRMSRRRIMYSKHMLRPYSPRSAHLGLKFSRSSSLHSRALRSKPLHLHFRSCKAHHSFFLSSQSLFHETSISSPLPQARLSHTWCLTTTHHRIRPQDSAMDLSRILLCRRFSLTAK